MLMGLSLLSQPAQAISFGFSFANLGGDAPTGTNQLVTGTIDGLVEGNNSGAGVTVTVLSTPTGELLGNYDFSEISSGGPNAFIVTNGNITLADSVFRLQSDFNVVLVLFTAGVFPSLPNGSSQLVDNSTPSSNGFFDDTQSATFTSTAVPEPLTILGAMTAAGFGAGFKRKLAKSLKK